MVWMYSKNEYETASPIVIEKRYSLPELTLKNVKHTTTYSALKYVP